MKKLSIIGLTIALVGIAYSGESGRYNGKISPVIQELKKGQIEKTVIQPGGPRVAPLATEIPLDSLRKLQNLPIEPDESPENQDGGGGEPPHILAPPIITDFQATGFTGWIPPDPVIAAGYDDIVVVVNSTIQIYSKDGTLLSSTSLYSFFSGVSPPGSPFDPKIFFDQYEKRYVLLALARDTSTHQSSYLIAVTPDSTATGYWWRWKLDATLDGSNPTDNWADYPGLGYDQQAVYITSNQIPFVSGSHYAKLRILNKSYLYSGGSLGWYDFWNWTNSDGSTVHTWKPAQSFGTVSSGYMLNTKQGGWNNVTLWRIDNPVTSPSLIRQATISVTSYQPPPPAEQLGDTAHINTLGSNRIPDPVIYRNGYLYTSFTEKRNWGSGNRAAIRWLKINTATNSATIDYYWGYTSLYYYFPALAVDHSNNMVAVFARSGASEYAGIRYTGWRSGDPSPQGSAWLKAGEGPYNLRYSPDPRNRWGDYFDAAIDPTDDYTVWIYGEYATNVNTWRTWVGRVGFLPDLIYYTPSGWSYPLVPRNTNDATTSYAPLPSYLNGNSTTYLNFAWKNQGDNPAMSTFNTRLLVDNELKYSAYTTYLSNGSWTYRINRGPYEIKGGRHTVFDSIDAGNVILESSENNNFYSHQFVWSPLSLAYDNGTTRTPPPDRFSPGGAYYNCDGYYLYVPATLWGGAAILPTYSGDDYDLLLYDDYVNSTNGFDTYQEYSGYGSGYVDFVLINRSAGAPAYNYFGAIKYSGGSANFYANGDYDIIFTPSLSVSGDADTFGTFSIDTNDVFDVYSVHITDPGKYFFKALVYDNVDIGISLYHKDSVHVVKSGYMAASDSAGAGQTEYFEVDIPDTGFYGFAIWKRDYTGAGQSVNYDVVIGLGPTNLVNFNPPGWDYPIVPRDTTGADIYTAHVTDSLPGDSTGTYLNFAFANIGMNDASTFYGKLTLDGESLSYWAVGGLLSNYYAAGANWGPYFVRGGRHTLGDSVDYYNDIWETDESDNFYERQFIWTPVTLGDNTPVVRAVPPDYGNGSYPNSDGFRYTRPASFAQAVGITPRNLNDDYDLRVYTDYTGSESGFSIVANASAYGLGATDYVVSTYTVAEPTIYPAVTRYSGTVNDSFVIEADNSFGHILIPPTTYTGGQLLPDEILDIYEVYLRTDSTYKFTLQNLIPDTSDIRMYLYSNASGYYGRSDYLVTSWTGQMAYTATSQGYYLLVVVKDNADDLPTDVAYDLGIEFVPRGTWIGVVSTDWHDPSNWAMSTVPTTSLDAVIPSWATYMPEISTGNGYCKNLTIESGASLMITSDRNLYVYGDLVNHGILSGPDAYNGLYFKGGWYDDGVYSPGTNSTVYANGSGIQQVYEQNTFYNFYVASTSTVEFTSHSTMDGNLYVWGTMSATNPLTPLTVNNNVNVYSGGVFNSDNFLAHVYGDLVLKSGGIVNVKGDTAYLRVHNNLYNEGTIDAGPDYTPMLDLNGNWIDTSGVFIDGHSTFGFYGSSNQYLGPRDMNFWNLVVSNGSDTVFINSQLVVHNNLDVIDGTLYLPNTSWHYVHGDVTLNYGGTLDLENNFSTALFVYGDWNDSGGVFHETSSTSGYTPWVVFDSSSTHNIIQGTGNSFSGIEFWGGTSVLQTPVRAYWYFNLYGGDVNTNGQNVWINRALQLVHSASTLYQDSGTIVSAGVNWSQGSVNLTGGTFQISLDDPYYPHWDDRFITFNPSDGYVVEFFNPSDASVFQGSGNYFGRLIINKSTKTLTKSEQPNIQAQYLKEPVIHSNDGRDPTSIKGKSTSKPRTQDPSLLSNTVTLQTDVTVRKSLEVAGGSNLNLGGNKLEILGIGMANNSTLTIYGTVSLTSPSDSLINSGTNTLAWIGSTGNLTVNDGYLFVSDQLYNTGSVSISGGVVETNTSGAEGRFITTSGSQFSMSGGVLRVNKMIYANTGSNWNVTGGEVHMFGMNNGQITISDPSVSFYNLKLGNGTTSKSINFSHVNGHLLIEHKMELLGNATAYYYGDTLQVTDTLLLNGNLVVTGATHPNVLQIGNNGRILVKNGGRLSTVGNATNGVTVTHLGAGRYYFDVYSGGWVAAEYTTFEYMKSTGIKFRSGSNLEPTAAFTNCTFRNGASGGSSRLITFNNSQTLTIEGTVFPENTWGSAYNVYKSNASGHITFTNATGLYAGEDYDYDPNDLVDWTVSFTAGDANGNGIVDAEDLVYLSNYLFHGGPAPTPLYAGDNDHDCAVTQADIDYLANYLYYGGPAPSPCGTMVSNTGNLPEQTGVSKQNTGNSEK